MTLPRGQHWMLPLCPPFLQAVLGIGDPYIPFGLGTLMSQIKDWCVPAFEKQVYFTNYPWADVFKAPWESCVVNEGSQCPLLNQCCLWPHPPRTPTKTDPFPRGFVLQQFFPGPLMPCILCLPLCRLRYWLAWSWVAYEINRSILGIVSEL